MFECSAHYVVTIATTQLELWHWHCELRSIAATQYHARKHTLQGPLQVAAG
jgi:hypothetical protein